MLSTLPLGYCTNVHPAQSVAEVEAGLDRYTLPVGRNLSRPLAAGLWLARPVVRELLASLDGPRRFADRLDARGLTCYALNAFPYGDFHSERVKEHVYLPDWSDPDRLAYTEDCARVLAVLLPAGGEGSISSVPLGFKPFQPAAGQALVGQAFQPDACSPAVGQAFQPDPRNPAVGQAFEPDPRSPAVGQAFQPDACSPARSQAGKPDLRLAEDFLDRAIRQLIELARWLDRLRDETGRTIRLALEPEPCCVLETTPETLAFFERLRERAAGAGHRELVERHIGVCYDVCHQAVEFEDVSASIGALARAGVRINKVHITCAIELQRPGENEAGRAELARYVEPRYLHQTIGRTSSGRILRAVDLTRELALDPDAEFRAAEAWRVHFHVPVDAERLGPLLTTRTELKQALAAVARLDYAPHLEVETYTWQVLPDGARVDLITGLTREMRATHELLDALRSA